jgi:hypothetical protein
MTTQITILTFFILTFSFAYGQNPQVKKEIKITTTFDYDYIKDGKLYLSRKAKVKLDTLISDFNQDGTLTNPIKSSYVTFGKSVNRDSLVLISNSQNLKHEREYWSDSTSIDIYTQIFNDSTIQTQLSKGDTIQINKSYFQNGKLIKCHNRDMRYGYGKFNQIITYDTKTENREVATVITTYFQNGLTDTVRIDNNKKSRIYKTLVYNQDKKEWFEKEKTQLKKRKRILWETFYHDYHKMYFTTKTTINYNKYGLQISEEKYDTYLKHIETKTTYEYEYY